MKNALCDVIREEELPKYLVSRNRLIGNLAQESVMKKCGYTVSSMTGLDDRDRFELLKQIIKYNILSQKEVESFLNWLIEFNSSNPARSESVFKWKTDLSSIAEESAGPIVRIGKVIVN